MTERWHLRAPEEYACQRADVRRAYPNLHFFPEERLVLRGSFPVALAGETIDRFQIEVILPDDYPATAPVVREIGGRIPRISDRHVEAHGGACLFIPEEEAVYFPPGSTLLDFLQGPVRSFFVSQLYFEKFGEWPFGQWAHGAAGTLQFYASRIGIDDPRIVLAFVGYLSRREIKGHWPCPCGSGKVLRRCHREKVAELRGTITWTVARRSFERLNEATRQQSSMRADPPH
ncbi:MAG: SEC-C domain-containing protein [Thermoanaerobaculia bacterium]